jgi:hypothetical protein
MASDHDLAFWRPYGVFFEGCVKAAHGAQVEGLDEMRRGLTLLSQQNATLFVPFLMLALAQAEARTGDIGRALATLDEGLAASGERATMRSTPNSIERGAKSCSSAIPRIPRLPRKPSRPPSPSQSIKACAPSACALRSP